MKKCFLLALLLLCVAGKQIFAATVAVTQAQQIALNFYKVKGQATGSHTQPAAHLVYTKTDITGKALFYVFDMNPAVGFVIIAADDNVIPVLGYSFESRFRSDFSKTGLSNWMGKTAANIQLALQNHALADSRITRQWASLSMGQNIATEKNTIVNPLCITTWDQEYGGTPPPFTYNLLCPWNSTDHQRCLTGCVATAQAQIMKYWNYPATGKGSFTYVDDTLNGYSNNYGTLTSNFAAHTYHWPLMPPILTGSEPLAQDSAVDVLMYDCCVSVGMDFGDDNQGGSGAEGLLDIEVQYGDSACSQYALVNYFSYNADTIKGIQEANFNAATWTAAIERDLNMGRPILYEGDDATQGGHAWVCDGYDANNLLHMNWGWSGFDNGYFAINNLTTSGNFNPVQNDAALIGILPKYPRAPLTDFGASITNSCTGNVQFRDFSQAHPTAWSWNFGDGNTSTLQNPFHTYTANGTYTVTLTASNPSGSTPKTVTNYITVNMPAAPTVSNVSANSPQSFSLTANTSNTVGWFDSNGNLLSNSNPFVTPVLNSTTTYYVEDSIVSPSTHVGAASKTIGSGSYATDPYALQFNVLSPCVIQSVYVYAQNAANRTIQVIDSAGNVIAQSTVHCPAGGSRITVNLNLNPGGPYYMQVNDTLGLYSNSAGGVYPYTDSLGLIKITGNTSFDASYYYFYDWVVKAPDCVSPRVAVTANIVTGISNVTEAMTFSMFPNPANSEVVLQTTETGSDITWSIKNILGQTMVSKTADVTQTHINVATLASGVYLVELRAGEKAAVKKLVINR